MLAVLLVLGPIETILLLLLLLLLLLMYLFIDDGYINGMIICFMKSLSSCLPFSYGDGIKY